MASDTCPPSVANYIDTLSCDQDYFPVFSLTEASLGEVESAIRDSTSHARDNNDIPQSVILADLPIFRPLIVNINNNFPKN